jgi:hypothetical protein
MLILVNGGLSRVIVGCGLLVALATGLWLYVRHGEIKHAAFEKRKAETAAYIQKRAVVLLKVEDINEGDPALRQQSFQAFFDAVQSPDLVRMKIWNREYTVVWSELRELIGQRFLDNHGVKEALEGKVAFELVESKDEQVSERAFQALSETYVPFFDATGEVAGVIEVYQPVTALNAEMRSQFQSSATAALAFAVAAFGGIMFVGRLLTKRGRTVEGRL